MTLSYPTEESDSYMYNPYKASIWIKLYLFKCIIAEECNQHTEVILTMRSFTINYPEPRTGISTYIRIDFQRINGVIAKN